MSRGVRDAVKKVLEKTLEAEEFTRLLATGKGHEAAGVLRRAIAELEDFHLPEQDDRDLVAAQIRRLHLMTERLEEQDREVLEVKLPKGPASYCSERINGRPPKGSYHVKKTYQVTIEPGAQSKLVRRRHPPCDRKFEALPPELDESPSQPQSGNAVEEVVTAPPQLITDAMNKRKGYYARAHFRHQRAPTFEKAKRFPALATHRSVPGWQEPHREDDKMPELSARQRTQRRLVAPTLSLAVRQETKRSPSPGNSWRPGLDAADVQRECTRTPMFCNEAYSPPVENQFREESEESRRRWMGESTFSCPGVPSLAEQKMLIARRNYAGVRIDSDTVQEEIEATRERGAENNLRLQCRHEMKLEAYKAEQQKSGHMSNFAKRELREAEELNHLELPEAPKPKKEESRGFGLDIGFRFRSSQPAIGM